MERGTKEKIVEMIKAFENKNLELEQYISKLSVLSRNEILKNISQDIVKNNSLIQDLIGKETQITASKKTEKLSLDFIIENILKKISKDPYKKVIFLREFLDLFQERISDMDKEVILKSLKDEKNIEKLREEMISLANIFKLNSQVK